LGTNRLQVQPGTSFVGGDVTLPDTSADQIRRLAAVEDAAAVTRVDVTIRRSELIDSTATNGIIVRAAETQLLEAIGGGVARGRWLDAASDQLPTVVLGATTARRLGIHRVDGRVVDVGGQPFTVIGR
jgi:putative ABC transport system permease protein